MKVKFRTNLGSRDALALGLNYTQCVFEAEIDVSEEAGESLLKRNLVEVLEPSIIQAVPPKPAIAEAKPGSVEKATADLKAYKAKAKSDE